MKRIHERQKFFNIMRECMEDADELVQLTKPKEDPNIATGPFSR